MLPPSESEGAATESHAHPCFNSNMRKASGCLALVVLCSSIVAAPPVKLKDLKIADFEKLPDDAMLDLDGRTVTKGSLLSEARKGGAPGAPLLMEADTMKAKFAQDQKSRLEAQNAAVISKVRTFASQLKAKRPALSASEAPSMNVVARAAAVDPASFGPGANFVVTGMGFGEEPGKVLVTGSWGTLDLYAAGAWGAWGPTWAGGSMPRSKVATAQTVSIVVETKDGRRTSPISASFHPSRVQLCSLLRLSSVSWPSGTCEVHPNGPGYLGPSIRCEHVSPPSGYVSVGTDRVSVNLKNGWVLDSYSLGVHPMGQAFVQKQISFTAGAPSMSANLMWAVLSSNGRVWWDMLVCGSGPNDGLPNQ